MPRTFRLLIAPATRGSVATVELLQVPSSPLDSTCSSPPTLLAGQPASAGIQRPARRAGQRWPGPRDRSCEPLGARRRPFWVPCAAFCPGHRPSLAPGRRTRHSRTSPLRDGFRLARGSGLPTRPRSAPRRCTRKMSTTRYGTLGDDLLGSSNAPGGNHPQVLMALRRQRRPGGRQPGRLPGRRPRGRPPHGWQRQGHPRRGPWMGRLRGRERHRHLRQLRADPRPDGAEEGRRARRPDRDAAGTAGHHSPAAPSASETPARGRSRGARARGARARCDRS